MAIINTVAHLNELTKDTNNDYYLVPVVAGTLYHQDIIQRLSDKQIATNNVNGDAFVKLYHDEIMDAVSEGYHVVTDAFHVGTVISGAVSAQDLGHHIPQGRLELRMNYLPSNNANKHYNDTHIFVQQQPATAGPVIQAVHNPAYNVPDQLNTNDMVAVKGLRIAVKGDQTDHIGLTFTPLQQGEPVRIPPNKLTPNTPSLLQFVLPDNVTPGQWILSIATQAARSSSGLTKYPRSFQYPNLITVV